MSSDLSVTILVWKFVSTCETFIRNFKSV